MALSMMSSPAEWHTFLSLTLIETRMHVTAIRGRSAGEVTCSMLCSSNVFIVVFLLSVHYVDISEIAICYLLVLIDRSS